MGLKRVSRDGRVMAGKRGTGYGLMGPKMDGRQSQT